MTTMGTVEAKSHFSEMVDRAASGEEIIITKRGIPVAKMTSIDDQPASEKRKKPLSNLQEFRKGKKTIRKSDESWNDIAREDLKW